jgi:hypothetical protein
MDHTEAGPAFGQQGRLNHPVRAPGERQIPRLVAGPTRHKLGIGPSALHQCQRGGQSPLQCVLEARHSLEARTCRVAAHPDGAVGPGLLSSAAIVNVASTISGWHRSSRRDVGPLILDWDQLVQDDGPKTAFALVPSSCLALVGSRPPERKTITHPKS